MCVCDVCVYVMCVCVCMYVCMYVCDVCVYVMCVCVFAGASSGEQGGPTELLEREGPHRENVRDSTVQWW